MKRQKTKHAHSFLLSPLHSSFNTQEMKITASSHCCLLTLFLLIWIGSSAAEEEAGDMGSFLRGRGRSLLVLQGQGDDVVESAEVTQSPTPLLKLTSPRVCKKFKNKKKCTKRTTCKWKGQKCTPGRGTTSPPASNVNIKTESPSSRSPTQTGETIAPTPFQCPPGGCGWVRLEATTGE